MTSSPDPARPTTVAEYGEWNAELLKRHRVSRRSVVLSATASALVASQYRLAEAAFAAGGGAAGKAGVVVSGRHLSFINDASGRPQSAMALTAQLVSKTGSLPKRLKGYVEIGHRAGHYGTKIEADIVHLLGHYAIPSGPVGSQFYLKAKLHDLDPDTKYHYRVRLNDGTRSGDAHFRTAPRHLNGSAMQRPARPFTFTAFADVGTNSAPTDPAYAWGQDPESVRAAGGTWPTGVFDDNYYSASDPVAGAGGTDPTPAVSMTNAMAAERPVFTLLAGDICYADPSGTGLPADDSGALLSTAPAGKNSYNPYVWDVFFNQIEAQAAYAPWMFATGNHDMEPLYGNTNYLGDSNHHGYGGHLKRLDLPRNGPHTCPSVYSFIYGNVGVIAVDANDLSYEIQTNTGYSGGAQLRWLKRTLKEWRTNPLVAPRIDFVVVFFHHCAYSTTNNHASDGGVRGALDPLFTQYQVDLVLQGHNHLMERTDPIKNGVPTRPAPDQSIVEPAKDGVTYLCIGSGGRPRYPFRPAPSATAPPPAGVTPTGAQALPEGQRYRGYTPPGGPNAIENNTENVVNSYVWTDAGTAVGSGGYPAGSKVPEQVTWSQVRYDDYAFVAVDVDPARPGHTTTMTVRTLADALPGSGERTTEIDRIVLKRKAGRAAKTI